MTVVEQYSKNTTRNHTEIVSIVEHENCECRCRVKKEVSVSIARAVYGNVILIFKHSFLLQNCTSKQVYDEKQCKCYCNNATDDDSCNKGPRTKWDAKTCSCVCPKVEDCVTAFDYNTCKWVIEKSLKCTYILYWDKTPSEAKKLTVLQLFFILWTLFGVKSLVQKFHPYIQL